MRVPKAITDAAGVRELDEPVIVVDGAVVRPAPKRPTLRLRDLLGVTTRANVHDEADFGTCKGREIW